MRIVLVGSLWLLSAVAAADTLRVGDHLLVSGDSAAQVRAALGRPSRVTHHRDRDRAARHRRGAAKKARQRKLDLPPRRPRNHGDAGRRRGHDHRAAALTADTAAGVTDGTA
ncbi:MAG TPA: hypothetical protein VGU03_14875 [Frateuria sp.]|uniref:hypothetical protein n=1 Tax=Frateuria sp. TaxID=2211372 RepID=UPI002DEF770A|nr:hypothetical protein [Frateuria sp.]